MRERGSLISERAIWRCFVQMCDALIHMHEHRILHRDLKPANVFLMKDGHVKVGDLGLGRFMNENTVEAFSKVGTPLYMSPEALRGQGYDWKSDVWSLGYVALIRRPGRQAGRQAGRHAKPVACLLSSLSFVVVPITCALF